MVLYVCKETKGTKLMENNFQLKGLEISETIIKLANQNEIYKKFIEKCWFKFLIKDFGPYGRILKNKLIAKYYSSELDQWVYIIAEPNNQKAYNKMITFKEFLKMEIF